MFIRVSKSFINKPQLAAISCITCVTYSMFKNSNHKNPNHSSIVYVVSIYNRCSFAKCVIKVFPNLFVFTFGIENIRLVLKLYLSLSLCAGSRPASLCWSLSTICLNRLLHNSSRLWKSVFKFASYSALLYETSGNRILKTLFWTLSIWSDK